MYDRTTRSILEGIFDGTTPVRRTNPQPGESPYYYLQSDTDNNNIRDMRKINVPTANTPNPAWGIQNNNMSEGLAYSNMGLSLQNPYNNSLNQRQFAQNNITQSDNLITNNNWEENRIIDNRFDNEPEHIQRMMNEVAIFIRNDEDPKSFPYLDSQCVITDGIGNNINTWEQFNNENWRYKDPNGRPATTLEKQYDYNKMLNLQKECNAYKAKFGKNNYKANHYEDTTNIRLPNRDMYNRMNEHLRRGLTKAREWRPDFDELEPPLQKWIIDVIYNTGNFTRENWRHAHDAIDRKDAELLLDQYYRSQVSKERKKWSKEQIESISWVKDYLAAQNK